MNLEARLFVSHSRLQQSLRVVGNEIGLRLSLELDGARPELMNAIDEFGFEPVDGGTVPPRTMEHA